MQPNLRNIPFVFDPFAFKQVDAVLATHYHQDHMSAEWAAHVINSGMTTTDENGNTIPVPFIGPKKSVETWIKWGVPAERCIVVKPGDHIKVKDIEIIALDSFDRTCIVTTDSQGPDREELTGKCPTDMDDKAVNYLLKTPGGNIYHSGDSHFSIYFAKHGKDYDVDVAFGSFGENPVGNQDKMTSIDILRMAESLKCKVVIPDPLGRLDELPARLRRDPSCLRLQKAAQRIPVPPVLLAGRRQVHLPDGQGQAVLSPSPRFRGLLRASAEHPVQILPVSIRTEGITHGKV